MLGDDEFDVAEKLNRFFIDSVDELASSIPAPLGSFADVHMGSDDCIEQVAADLLPIVLVVTETLITVDIEKGKYQIDGYNSVVNNSDSRHTGGVIIYIKDTRKYKQVQHYSLSKECSFIRLSLDDDWGLYKSPSGNNGIFFSFIQDWFDSDLMSSNGVILMGDVN
ncbi:hypothetical protein HHI36_014554 [Cryptolaemus montrouzieri]|uniref:Uncharacterized protein n=1 Tax=Cryptolaemus montrouzieri TaxID=559131 RepID=A0ABD2N354_9CUCU